MSTTCRPVASVGTAGSTTLVLQIAQRELAVLRERLGLPEDSCSIRDVVALGAGKALHVRIDSTNTTAIFAGFGTRGVTAEKLATAWRTRSNGTWARMSPSKDWISIVCDRSS